MKEKDGKDSKNKEWHNLVKKEVNLWKEKK